MSTAQATRLACPVAHIDDPLSLERLLAALHELHGPGYGFAVGRWDGTEEWRGKVGQAQFRFVVSAQGAAVAGGEGDRIRGLPPAGPFAPAAEGMGVARAAWQESLWPGDVVCLEPDAAVTVTGAGVYFEVTTDLSGYPAPRVAFLRYLTDKPGGCAAYPGAFRREALPPVRAAAGATDLRGVNRVNEHTLDMRIDREPPPSRHHHGPVPVGSGEMVNHTETAIVLPRAVYGLPEIDGESQGRIWLYLRPQEDPTDVVEVPVRPGSIVVTPATAEGAAGHCFVNAFAMLVAIPGFVSPYRYIDSENR
jgi:hypothetical protein